MDRHELAEQIYLRFLTHGFLGSFQPGDTGPYFTNRFEIEETASAAKFAFDAADAFMEVANEEMQKTIARLRNETR